MTTASPAVSEAIYKHPGLVELYCSEVGRPRKGPGQEQHLALLAPALDQESDPESCSKVQAVRIRNCFMLCGQLSDLLSAICEGKSSVTSLALTKLGSGCINAHTDCPLSAHLLGQATGKLNKLCLDNLGWTCNLTTDKLEALFQGIKEGTALKELILSKVHIAFITNFISSIIILNKFQTPSPSRATVKFTRPIILTVIPEGWEELYYFRFHFGILAVAPDEWNEYLFLIFTLRSSQISILVVCII